MFRLRFCLYCIIFFIIISCSRNIYVNLNWQDTPVVADGNMNEWPNPLRFYDYKSKINYSITNDRKRLYFCLKISDELTQFRIMEGGMELSLDTSDKKLFPVKIIYPQGNFRQIKDDSKDDKKLIDNNDILKSKQIFLGLLKELEVKGFKYPISGNLLSNNPYGIAVSINWDKSGVMVYEMILPFATFYKDELIPADTGKLFFLKIHINSLPVNDEMKISRNTQEEGNNITGRGSTNVYSGHGLNTNIYGTGAGGYGNMRNTENLINPLTEPMEFKLRVKLSYQ